MAKRNVGLALASLALGLLLTACGQGTSVPTGSSADYAALIESTRTEEEGQLMPIVTAPVDEGYKTVFDMYGFSAGSMERYAISLSVINTKAYGVAIILPAQDRADDVIQQLETFVDAQQRTQENYLPDQYEVAKAAQIKMMDSGEVVLVMAENAPEVMSAIESGLAGGASQSG